MKLQFRDGEREVLDYLADLMAGFETYRMTYDEAVAKANADAVNTKVQKAMDKIIQDHFKNLRGMPWG